MQTSRLQGKRALVTGAGSGIGRAISIAFAREGAAVQLADIDVAAANDTDELIAADGGRSEVSACDVACTRAAHQAVESTVANFGGIDVLVNNAAWFAPREPVAEITDEHWDRNLAVNVTGPFLMSRAAIPAMTLNGGGSIVHVASQMARVANFGQTAYCTAKGALLMLAKGIALDHAKDNIRCNTLSPGGIATQGMADVYGSMEAAEREWGEPMHILGRLGQVEEIAAGAVFLASDESSFMTGTDLLIDGGYTAV